jgi:hypothetical protein
LSPPVDSLIRRGAGGGGNGNTTDGGCGRLREIVDYPYVIAWKGEIRAVLNRERVIFILVNSTSQPAPRPLPPAIPATSIVPVTGDQEKEMESLLSMDRSRWPSAWKLIVVTDTMWQQWTTGWYLLTNECVGPICQTRGVLDVLTGKCMANTVVLEKTPVDTYVRFLSSLLPSSSSSSTQKPPQMVSPTYSEQWKRKQQLSHQLIYRDRGLNSPQIEIMGVINREGEVYSFPYNFPVEFSYEFNSDVFGVDGQYLLPLVAIVEQQRSRGCHVLSTTPQGVQAASQAICGPEVKTRLRQTPSSTIDLKYGAQPPPSPTTNPLTASKTVHQLLSDLQDEAGSFIILPTSCLFQATGKSGSTPGLVVRESACYELSSSSGSNGGGGLFRAYLVDRDPTSASHVIVLAGFNDQMKLIVPEQPIRLEINEMSRIPAMPVDFSRQLASRVSQQLSTSDSIKITDFRTRLHGHV